jgi:hypothetical protein
MQENRPTELTQGKLKITRWLAWLMLALILAGIAGLLALEWMGCRYLFDPSQARPAQAYGWALIPVLGLAFSFLGTFIIAYRPRNRIGWLILLAGLASVISLLWQSYGGCGLSGAVSLPYYVEAIWLDNTFGFIVFLMMAFLPALFPDGGFLSPRWRQLAQVVIGISVIIAALKAIWPGPLTVFSLELQETALDNPLAVSFFPAGARTLLTQVGLMLVLAFIITGIVSLVLRWRQADTETRQQIKWLTFFLATAGLLFFSVELIGNSVYPAIFDGWFYLLVLVIFFLGLPLVVGLAVFKYRLYDIDIVIRRTLSYAVLTAILAIFYFSAVVVIQSIFRGLAGNPESPVIIVVSTLAIAAMFNPLRIRVQHFIDRRFYRSKYDAARALDRFAQTARDEVELERLTAELLHVVQETVQPERVTVWLKTADFGRENE